jgi:hypothetical protein
MNRGRRTTQRSSGWGRQRWRAGSILNGQVAATLALALLLPGAAHAAAPTDPALERSPGTHNPDVEGRRFKQHNNTTRPVKEEGRP